MPLKSNLFKGDAKLNACLVNDAAHLTEGTTGDHVGKVQVALADLDGLDIEASELLTKRYGPSTAAAVLKYKQKRTIINRSYQSREDAIVGKMTIASLDDEMFKKQETDVPLARLACERPAEVKGSARNERAASVRVQLALTPTQKLFFRG